MAAMFPMVRMVHTFRMHPMLLIQIILPTPLIVRIVRMVPTLLMVLMVPTLRTARIAVIKRLTNMISRKSKILIIASVGLAFISLFFILKDNRFIDSTKYHGKENSGKNINTDVDKGINIGNDYEEKKATLENTKKIKEPETSCQDKIKNFSNKELVDMALSIPSEDNDNGFLFDIVSKYLKCLYEKSSDEMEKSKIIDDAMPLISKYTYKKGQSVDPLIIESFKNSEESFTKSVSLGNYMEYCPDKLPEMCKKENGIIFEKSSDWCKNICSILENYKNDRAAYNNEVKKITNIKNVSLQNFNEISWRIPIIFNFDGENEAVRICESFFDEPERVCLRKVNMCRIRKIECDQVSDKMYNLICEKYDSIKK